MTKIAFITAIFGRYEATTKPFVEQKTNDPSVEVDFICFTDSPETLNNAAGWIIDSTPYHTMKRSPIYHPEKHNSFENNHHTFNKAKYYKQSFHNIPRLAKYDIVIWLDGTIQITSPIAAQTIIDLFKMNPDRHIVAWHHEGRTGSMAEEVRASYFERYHSTHWFGQDQPFQDVDKQYAAYVADGYKDVGIWCTCFVAFNMEDKEWCHNFLDMWYDQTLTYTTQDQLGFPYCVFKMNHMPYTLPDGKTTEGCHYLSNLHVKKEHHQ